MSESGYSDDEVAAVDKACDLLVATYVAQALTDRVGHGPSAEQLMEDPGLRHRDFALLGLGSLDWISLAARLETETGVEFPDQVLLEPKSRCLAGWSRALADAGTA